MCAQHAKIYKQGMLKKQGGSMGGWKTWKDRWFVFHEGGISYYADEQSYIKGKKELGFLHMDDHFAIRNHDDHSENFFRIECTSRTLIVKAKTAAQKKDWLEILPKVQKDTSSFEHLLRSFSISETDGFISDARTGRRAANPWEDGPESPRLSATTRTISSNNAIESEDRKSRTSSFDGFTQTMQVKMNSRSIREGWLDKLGGRIQSWKRRYFILVPGELEYYKHAHDKKPAGSIHLTDQTVIVVVNIAHTFTVSASADRNSRKYIITAPDDKERDSWLAALQTQIKNKVIFPKNTLKGSGAVPTGLSGLSTEASSEVQDATLLKILEGDIYEQAVQHLSPNAKINNTKSLSTPSTPRDEDIPPPPPGSISPSSPSPMSSSLPTTQSAIVEYRGRQAEFIKFAQSMYSEENVHFYIDCDQFRKLREGSKDQAATAETIYRKYLVSGAEYEIGIPPYIKRELCEQLADPNSSTYRLSPDMFEAAQKHVFIIMRTELLPKYLEVEPGALLEDHSKHSQSVAAKAKDKIVESKTTTASIDDLLHELVQINTTSGAVDHVFRRAFLLNHIHFMSSDKLLSKLEEYYNQLNYNDRVNVAKKLNLISIISTWLKSFPLDFVHTRTHLQNLLKQWIRDAETKPFETMLESPGRSHKPSMALSKSLGTSFDRDRGITKYNGTLGLGGLGSGGKAPVVSDGIRLLMNDLRATLQLSQADILAFMDRQDSPAAETTHRLSMSDYVISGHSQRDRESAAGFKNWFDDDTTMQTQSDIESGGEAKSILDDISELDEGASTPRSPSQSENEAHADICDFGSHRVSRCLTRIDHQYFKAISPREFTNKEWTRTETAALKSGNILTMVELFNRRSYWVASEILSREEERMRVKMIKIFVEIAYDCYRLHNFYSVFAIMTGLSLSPVYRLKNAWSKLSSSTKDKFRELNEFTDRARNFRNYRKALKDGLGTPQIPHLAVTLKDCFQLEEIKTLDQHGHVNFHKYMKQYKELADCFQGQRMDYHIPIDKLLIGVLDAAYSRLLAEDKMWQRSYRYEPKEANE